MNANTGTNICLDCGLCCDGTYLDFAPVTQEEADVLESKGLPISVIDQRLRIQLPCRKYDSCCTIYHDRPAVCRSFRCKLLKSIDKGRVETDHALQQIHLLKSLKSELLQIIPDSTEKSYFREVRDFLVEIEKGSPEYRLKHAKALMLGTKFMNLINDDFVSMIDESNELV